MTRFLIRIVNICNDPLNILIRSSLNSWAYFVEKYNDIFALNLEKNKIHELHKAQLFFLIFRKICLYFRQIGFFNMQIRNNLKISSS